MASDKIAHADIPVALTIAGSDSSSGAGLQADLKTFSALGVYGLTTVTCVVAESPGIVSNIEPVSVESVREQLRVLRESFPIAAIKTGLLCSAEIVAAVAEILNEENWKAIPLVVDPVMIATSGDRLLEADAIAIYENKLFRRAQCITPNLDEASALWGKMISDRAAMSEAARGLAERYGTSVLLKGGHLKGNEAVDLLCENGTIAEFSAPFVAGVSTHGTGCTYSAAIAAGLAKGKSLRESIAEAKKFVTNAIRESFQWGSVQALNHSTQS